MNNSKIKICGIKKIETLKCCIQNNINYFGLIFYKKSPRYISDKCALDLINYSKNKSISSVGVFVNENIEYLNMILKKLNFNFIQLHGEENDNYIRDIKKRNNVKIIKVISVCTLDDIKKITKYPNSDLFLFDYKPSKKELPGGNAKKFNWSLLRGIKIEKPWFLSGGININNINDIRNYAIPYGIDVSSGVEENPGIKNNKKIVSLVNAYDSK
ncbi:MAG: phosphoribosylanthranilate isomerase [Alphaproteobacteria bacterium]